MLTPEENEEYQRYLDNQEYYELGIEKDFVEQHIKDKDWDGLYRAGFTQSDFLRLGLPDHEEEYGRFINTIEGVTLCNATTNSMPVESDGK